MSHYGTLSIVSWDRFTGGVKKWGIGLSNIT